MGAAIKLFLFLGLAVLLPNKVSSVVKKRAISRIVGGYDTTIQKYPWQVQIRHGYRFMCGGSLISSRIVLTVAHCVQYDPKERKSDFLVFAGKQLSRLSQNDWYKQERHVDRVIMHPRYRHKGLHHDIALLVLEAPVNFNEAIQPVKLTDSKFDRAAVNNRRCFASGHGLHKQSPDQQPVNVLYAASIVFSTRPTTTPDQQPVNIQEIRVNVIPNGYCKHVLNADYNIKSTKITGRLVCTLEKGGICNGDSGGPMGCFDKNGEFRQVGIVSWGPEESCKKGPAVYTRIIRYAGWIAYKMRTIKY